MDTIIETVDNMLSQEEKTNLQDFLDWKRTQVILEELYRKAVEDGIQPISKAHEREWTEQYLQKHHKEKIHIAKIVGSID